MRQIQVFVAGPSDVGREKRIAVQLIEGLNKTMCPRLRLSLAAIVGSVDAPLGYGRPQGRITPLADRCALLIGIFARRFGTPTGVADSGSQEEIERALGRRRRGMDTPELFLFFRHLSKRDLEDPGPQMQRLLEFKASLKGEVLFQDYSGVDAFQTLLMEQLITKVWELYDRNSSVTATRAPPHDPGARQNRAAARRNATRRPKAYPSVSRRPKRPRRRRRR